MYRITDAEFSQVQRFILEKAGINLASSKKALVVGRLGKRLALHGLSTFTAYLKLLSSGTHPEEVHLAVELLTTNETYFFREIKHFEQLRDYAFAARNRTQAFKVWSAASSSGEEAYSIAMVLDEQLASTPWEVLGTDINEQMLRTARRALYPMARASHMPPKYLKKYCLRGSAEFEGQLLIQRSLRAHVHFEQLNLNEPLPELGPFDLIFLRNVMIYFNDQTKREVLVRVSSMLKPGGLLFVGHSESLSHLALDLKAVAPAIYCKI